MRAYAIWLGALAVAFLGRVVGQLVVLLYSPSFLPPMSEWYSGLMPYVLLLPTQVLILLIQAETSRQLWRGSGWLVRARPRLGAGLKWFALVYFASMVARYAITMTLVAERRWLGGTIPIVFHCVLAAWVYLLSRQQRDLPAPAMRRGATRG